MAKQLEDELRTRVRQQRTIAELGRRALSGTALPVLMNETVSLVSNTLEVEYCNILELLPSGDRLLLTAGVGWREGYVGRATVDASSDSLAGYTLQSSAPVIVENFPAETRFSAPPLLDDHGVVSGVGVIVRGGSGPFGVLGAHTTSQRTFTTDDINFLQAIAHVLESAIERKHVEEALHNSEERYRLLFDSNPQSAWVYDLETLSFLAVNESAVRRYGYSREEFLAMSIKDICPAEDVPSLLKNVSTVTLGLDTKSGPCRHRKKDGTIIYVEITSHAFVYGGRRAELVLANDITERKRAEEKFFVHALEREASEERLRESEQRYRNLVENSQGLICTHDMEGTLLSVNPAVCHLGGYQPSEMVGRNLREFLMPAVRPFFGAYLERIGQEKIVSGILRGMTKDGRERVWAYRNVRFEEPGKPPYVLGHAVDITERVRAEEALRETEARLRTVIANSPIVLFALDRQGVFTLSEGKGLVALGLEPGEVVGQTVFDVYADVPQILENCRRALVGERFASIMEVAGLIFEVVYVPLQDRNGVVTGVIGVATDITEKNRLEMELLRAAQISLIGELAAGLAHEIKNPLAGIQGVVQVLIREPGRDEAERGLLEAVAHEVRRIDAIVDMLLDQARVRVRQVARESLNEVVNRAKALARNQAAARGSKIDIEFEPALESLVITIDAAQIQGAVLNLIINAIEAIDNEGRITVRVKRGSGGTGGVYPYGVAIIEVEDTGRGIPDDSFGRIFSAFFTTKPGGTGLGLPAVRRVAEAHGGQVEVKSALGRGSVFALSLPLSAQDLT